MGGRDPLESVVVIIAGEVMRADDRDAMKWRVVWIYAHICPRDHLRSSCDRHKSQQHEDTGQQAHRMTHSKIGSMEVGEVH